MNFTLYDLGHLSAGDLVRVNLRGTEANVRLLDSSNLRSFQRNASHQYVGGHYTRSPVQLKVPSSGTWHVVVDLGGFTGSVESSVEVVKAA
jgi:hypothetical protein